MNTSPEIPTKKTLSIISVVISPFWVDNNTFSGATNDIIRMMILVVTANNENGNYQNISIGFNNDFV